jgi:group I intron endonuclease
MIIYKTINLINNKIYIGKDVRDRNYYYGSGMILKQAIKKYGIGNFKKEIIECCESKEELCEREKYWIEKYHSTNPKIGYNITIGGTGGDTFTMRDELSQKKTKEILRQKSLGHTHNLGIKWTKEQRDNLKKIRCERKPSNTKKWKVISPDNKEYIIFGLGQFCRENNLRQSEMWKVANYKANQHKGWRCEYVK